MLPEPAFDEIACRTRERLGKDPKPPFTHVLYGLFWPHRYATGVSEGVVGNEYIATAWIFPNQLGCRNITDEIQFILLHAMTVRNSENTKPYPQKPWRYLVKK